MSIYKTKDFYLACLLMSKGYELVDSKSKNKTVWFHFAVTSKEELQNLIDDFINYEAMTNVKMFTKSMARLRKELDKHKTPKFNRK